MNADPEIFAKLLSLGWFLNCGTNSHCSFPFPTERVLCVKEAVREAQSESWKYAKTEAQGDLTGYLAKNHSELYGGHWNQLVKVSRERIEREIMPAVINALVAVSAASLGEVVLLDLTRIAVYSTYRKRFSRLPDFFQNVLLVYERGHLPCGWVGDLGLWPEGRLAVF